MKVCILGVGRSGTTALYCLVQEMMIDRYGEDVDFIYEPFLWDKTAFNGKYSEVKDNFNSMNSISSPGIYFHQKLPLFIEDPEKYKTNEYVGDIFAPNDDKQNILVKFLRANGRFLLLNRVCPDCKFIFIVRNPVDVINSVITRFSFYGSEFHKDDFGRFKDEIARIYGVHITPGESDSRVKKEALYWYYMNKFALESFEKTENKPLIVCYEDYVSNNESQVDKICDLIGLEKKDIYYKYSKKEGGSLTKQNYLNRREIELLGGYLKKYKELLKMAGCAHPVDFDKIMAKYEATPGENSRQEIITGRTPNMMNTRILELERKLAECEKKVTGFKEKESITRKKNGIIEKRDRELKKLELKLEQVYRSKTWKTGLFIRKFIHFFTRGFFASKKVK